MTPDTARSGFIGLGDHGPPDGSRICGGPDTRWWSTTGHPRRSRSSSRSSVARRPPRTRAGRALRDRDHDAPRLPRRRAGVPRRRRRDRRAAGAGHAAHRHELDRAGGGAGGGLCRRRRGGDALDAPVSGGDVGAREGTLSIMVGGRRRGVRAGAPGLRGARQDDRAVGEAGAGQTAKACNQILVAVTIEAVSEALVLGSRPASTRPLIEVLSGGLAANRVMEVSRKNFLEHEFTPGLQDRACTTRISASPCAPPATARRVLPPTATVDQMLAALAAAGDGGLDHSALLTVIEQQSSHRIT